MKGMVNLKIWLLLHNKGKGNRWQKKQREKPFLFIEINGLTEKLVLDERLFFMR